MTKHQAFALDAVVGCLITWGSVPLLTALGVGERIQLVVAMLGLVGTCAMVGVITTHYARKRIEAEESDRH
ncbi:MAG TPA: hypothetical protein VH299_04230 [Solirubrobacterales bacterium]|jgi:hypothetical protein|nr:hypothetical protein [Solirubrobacterales bacterium]